MNIEIKKLLDKIIELRRFCKETIDNSDERLDHVGQREFFIEIQEELGFFSEAINCDIIHSLYIDEGEELKKYFDKVI